MYKYVRTQLGSRMSGLNEVRTFHSWKVSGPHVYSSIGAMSKSNPSSHSIVHVTLPVLVLFTHVAVLLSGSTKAIHTKGIGMYLNYQSTCNLHLFNVC